MSNTSVRVFFSKMGRAKYISHLDLYRLFQRATRRAKLPIWMTEGFNPHTYITFALPLSLGTEGVCECLDTKVTEDISFDEIKEKLSKALPDDIKILKVCEPVYKHTEIEKALYEIETDESMDKLRAFFDRDTIITEKKTKKGITEIDLKPYIEIVSMENGVVKMKLPAGVDVNINPNLVFEAYEKAEGCEIGKLNIKRTAIFCKNGEEFR